MAKKPGDDRHEQFDEELFEQYLEGDSPVSDAFQAMGQPEPPARLDRAILGEAREAARPARKSWLDKDLVFWRHWAKPLSTAVIMGVCLTVVLRVMDYATLQPPVAEDGASIEMEQRPAAPAREQPAFTAEQPAAAALTDAPTSADERTSPEVRRMRAPAAAQPADPRVDDAMDAASERPQEDMLAAAREQEESSRAVVVTARKQEESLQEAPLAITALTNADSGAVDRYSIQDSNIVVLAGDAPEAWAKGARPAADVWLAGIETLYLAAETVTPAIQTTEQNGAESDDATLPATRRDVNAARIELAKMARVYPAEARQFSARAKLETELYSNDDDTDLIDNLADPRVWNAGIDWLYRNGRDADAAAELAKLSRVYPDY